MLNMMISKTDELTQQAEQMLLASQPPIAQTMQEHLILMTDAGLSRSAAYTALERLYFERYPILATLDLARNAAARWCQRLGENHPFSAMDLLSQHHHFEGREAPASVSCMDEALQQLCEEEVVEEIESALHGRLYVCGRTR